MKIFLAGEIYYDRMGDIIKRERPYVLTSFYYANKTTEEYMQYSFFMPAENLERDRKVQKAVLEIKNKFGKNAILKGISFEEGATTRERNNQIGGHKANG